MEKEGEEEKPTMGTPILNDDGKGRKKKEKGKPCQKSTVEKFSINSGSFCETNTHTF